MSENFLSTLQMSVRREKHEQKKKIKHEIAKERHNDIKTDISRSPSANCINVCYANSHMLQHSSERSQYPL